MVELLAQCGELFAARPSRTSGSGFPVHRPSHHGGLQSCTRGEVLPGRWAKLALKGSSLRLVRRVERVCKTRSVHRAWSVSAAEPVLRPTWRHRTAKLARRGRAQGSAGPSGERARRDRREPLAPLVRRDLPGPKGDPSPPPIFRVVTETETLAARGVSFWPALYARAAQSMERSA